MEVGGQDFRQLPWTRFFFPWNEVIHFQVTSMKVYLSLPENLHDNTSVEAAMNFHKLP